MPMWRTEYRLPHGGRATTSCYARDPAHLAEVVALRRMGEELADPVPFRPTAPEMASDLLRGGRLAAANHALIWTAMVGVQAGVATPWDLLHDQGLLHRLAHLLHSSEERHPLVQREVPQLAGDVGAFERRVPGVHPCWAGEDIEPAPESYTVDAITAMTLRALDSDLRALAPAVRFPRIRPLDPPAIKDPHQEAPSPLETVTLTSLADVQRLFALGPIIMPKPKGVGDGGA